MESPFVVLDLVEEARQGREIWRSAILAELKRTPNLSEDVKRLLELESAATRRFHELWTQSQVNQ